MALSKSISVPIVSLSCVCVCLRFPMQTSVSAVLGFRGPQDNRLLLSFLFEFALAALSLLLCHPMPLEVRWVSSVVSAVHKMLLSPDLGGHVLRDAEPRPVLMFPLLLVGSQELVLKVLKRGRLHAVIRVTPTCCFFCHRLAFFRAAGTYVPDSSLQLSFSVSQVSLLLFSLALLCSSHSRFPPAIFDVVWILVHITFKVQSDLQMVFSCFFP